MKMLLALSLVAFASLSHAAESACTEAAKEKKLAGAAQKSFVKKCEADAKAKCEAAAAEKKLAGAEGQQCQDVHRGDRAVLLVRAAMGPT